MYEDIKKIIKKNKLWVILILVGCFITLIRHMIMSNLPVWALTNQTCDDDLMFQMAHNISYGNWLGTYNSNTLIKGPFFSLLLAIFSKFGLPYIGMMNIIYTCAVLYFIFCIKDLFKNKKILIIIYIILLFNPVSYASWTLQRVYRNGITLSQVLIVVGSMFALYYKLLNSDKNKLFKMLPYSIIAGLTLGTFWTNREDGIWLLPFVIVVIMINLAIIIINKKKEKESLKMMTAKLVITILPMIILIGTLHVVRFINYKYYGVYQYNEINDGYFGKVIQSIYSIKTDEDIQYVSATRNKIKIAYEVSPTLNSVKEQLDFSLDIWDNSDRNPGDKEVEDGWFWWALKGGVEGAGYYQSATMSNKFYKKVYEEIENAKKSNKIETQFTMPAKLMSPWKKRYFKEEITTMAEVIKYVINFEGVGVINGEAQYDTDFSKIRLYETFTNSNVIYPTSKDIKIKGWYTLRNNEKYKLELQNENNETIQQIELLDSMDVYNILSQLSLETNQSKKCRFEIELLEKQLKYDFNTLNLVVIDNNDQVIEKININENPIDAVNVNDVSVYNFDEIQLSSSDIRALYTQKYVDISNDITMIYTKLGQFLTIIAFLIYLIITILLFKNKELIHIWLLITGILCSFLVLVAGVAYNHITACHSILYMYLSGSYPLLLAFDSICIVSLIDITMNYKKSK